MDKLATFRIQDEDWLAFQALCKTGGSNASKELIGYIQGCLKAGKVGTTGEAETTSSGVTMGDVDAAIAPLRDELAELREALGKFDEAA
jgi:hypothetical protein